MSKGVYLFELVSQGSDVANGRFVVLSSSTCHIFVLLWLNPTWIIIKTKNCAL